jgi:hypothetical protein
MAWQDEFWNGPKIQRTVGMSYKTAWFLCQHIRHATHRWVARTPLNGYLQALREKNTSVSP